MNLLSPQLEYIRSKQKDAEILAYITNSALDCAKDWFNLSFTSEIIAATEVFYLASTLLIGKIRQTPGQEHTSTALVDFSKVFQFKRILVSTNYPLAAVRFAPTVLKTISYILFKSLFPYFLKKFWKGSEDLLQEVINLNFAVFLLTGYFDEISKRLLGLVFFKLQRPNASMLSLKNLGYVLLMQSFFSIYKLSRRLFEIQSKEEQGIIEESVGNNDCCLCLSALKNPTATACGHVFCWNCILTAANVNAFCPNCRQPITPQSLLHLRNL